ncbi:MAG: hypothetical protein CTY37_00215 [Methylotenera sp.]|nr:MAG: hypothetical protein CTY37_00215 [Methylotenera sp.]PPD19052.1 MAG: hypothetical protein CTY27_00060 [Methylotenera sp.]
MIRGLFKFIGKLLGFQSEAYLRKQEAFKEASKYDPPFIKTWVTPFNFVLVSVNAIVCWIFFLPKLNFTVIGSLIAYVCMPLMLSIPCLIVYLLSDEFLFSKIKKLKTDSGNEDNFPKMTAKVILACSMTYLLFFVLAILTINIT